MSEALIRAEIKSIIQGISGIGAVHDYTRWSMNWDRMIDLFKSTDDKIHAWMISRKSVARRQITMGEKELAHVFSIRGIYGLKDADASELIFQGIVDDVAEAFDDVSDINIDTLNQTCSTIQPDWGPMNGAAGLQVDIIDIRKFGNVLCHVAECRLCAIEQVDV